MEPADAGCAGLVATQGMIHVGAITPTHFLNSRNFFMINILLTDDLIEQVNRHLKSQVLPVEMSTASYRSISTWERDDNRRYDRVPERHRANATDGYRSRGTVYPINSFGNVPVITNTGIPMFDGRGSVWLLVDGIAIVFEDAMIYCIIYSGELQQWLMSKIHCTLFNEYDRLVMEHDRVQRAVAVHTNDVVGVATAPIVAADITPATTVVNSIAENSRHDSANALVLEWSAEPIPFSPATLISYLDREQFCRCLIEPIIGARLHHQTRRRFNSWTKTEFMDSVLETCNVEIVPPADSYPRQLNNIYLMLAVSKLCFIHLFTDIALSITVTGKEMVVTNVFLVRENGVTWLVFTPLDEIMDYCRLRLSSQQVLDIIGFMSKRALYIKHARDIHEWVEKHLM